MTAAIRRRIPGATPGAVDRAMRTLGLAGVRRGKAARTTIPAADGKRAGDLLNRDFTAAAPNRVWVADFTYVRTWAGFVYVAFLVDVFAQRIIGWHADTIKATELVDLPLPMGLWQRGREGHPVEHGQLVAHSDAGSQYTSIRFTEHLQLEGIQPLIGTVGDAYDNSLMESSLVCSKPKPSAPRSSTKAPSGSSPMWNSLLPGGSIGGTTNASTAASVI